MTESLHLDLLAVLSAADRGQVFPAERGGRRIWLVAGRPNTPAVQSLLDSGLIGEASYGHPPVLPTAKGDALLDTLKPEGD